MCAVLLIILNLMFIYIYLKNDHSIQLIESEWALGCENLKVFRMFVILVSTLLNVLLPLWLGCNVFLVVVMREHNLAVCISTLDGSSPAHNLSDVNWVLTCMVVSSLFPGVDLEENLAGFI